jgi:hypothetical protein
LDGWKEEDPDCILVVLIIEEKHGKAGEKAGAGRVA